MRLIWVLGDQLLPDHPLLLSTSPDLLVGMIESAPRGSHIRYHQQKLTLLYSAMRHYAAGLKKRKYHVLYHHLMMMPALAINCCCAKKIDKLVFEGD